VLLVTTALVFPRKVAELVPSTTSLTTSATLLPTQISILALKAPSPLLQISGLLNNAPIVSKVHSVLVVVLSLLVSALLVTSALVVVPSLNKFLALPALGNPLPVVFVKVIALLANLGTTALLVPLPWSLALKVPTLLGIALMVKVPLLVCRTANVSSALLVTLALSAPSLPPSAQLVPILLLVLDPAALAKLVATVLKTPLLKKPRKISTSVLLVCTVLLLSTVFLLQSMICAPLATTVPSAPRFQSLALLVQSTLLKVALPSLSANCAILVTTALKLALSTSLVNALLVTTVLLDLLLPLKNLALLVSTAPPLALNPKISAKLAPKVLTALQELQHL
jgi:hypothetical protein